MAPHLKRIALSGFLHTGMDRVGFAMHAGDALVLGYHGILAEEKAEPFRYHHTIAEFTQHLNWLARRCTPVDLAGFAKWRNGDLRPRKPIVLLTFDDGYLNNAVVAAPLLRRKGFPALFFLSTGYIEGERALWPDEVFARVMAWAESTLEDPEGTVHVLPEQANDRENEALAIVEACKRCSDQRRQAFMAHLSRETPYCKPLYDPEAQAFMSWDDVRGLANAGFDLGSHTVSHPILSNISREQIRSELRDSRETIEARTGARCRALAYPNGRPRDIGDVVLSETAQAGYDFAFTVSSRWCPRTADPLQLDRILPPGHSALGSFALHASGWRQLLAR